MKDNPTGREQETDILVGVWNLFSSMKTAIVLLLLLAAASVLGTVIEQNPLSQEYIRIHGYTKYSLLRSLGLTDVYHSGWYRFLLSLVGVNLFVCSVNRFRLGWRRAYQQKVPMEATRIAGMQRSEVLSGSGTVDNAANSIGAALRLGSYRVLEERKNDDVLLYGAKGTISLWGPYLTHLSILVIFAGAIAGSLLGFEGYTTIVEGQSTGTYYRRGVGEEANLGFRVALREFHITHDSAHNPTGYKSDLAVYQQDKLVAQKVIDVNHPLTYKGVSFHQSDYGLAELTLKVTAPNGDSVRIPFGIETRNGPHGKEYAVSGDPLKQVEIDGRKLTIFVHNLAPDYTEGHQTSLNPLPIHPAANIMVNDRFPEYKGLDAWSNLGWLAVSKPVDFKGYTIVLDRIVDYTGLQVSRNPGLPVIYIGFGLLMMGVFLSFYVNHMVIRISIAPCGNGTTVTAGAVSRTEPSVFDRDFQRIRSALAQQVQA